MSASTHLQGHASAGTVKIFSHVEILEKPIEAISDSENPTDNQLTCDYTALRRRRSHHWTLEERQVLCILRRWYCNSWKELAVVFNGYMAANSRSDDIPEVTGSALAMQLFEMQRHGVKAEAFESVFIETLFVDEFCVWTDIRYDLEQTARSLSIMLEKRVCENKEELLRRSDQIPRSVKRKKAMRCVDSVLGHTAFHTCSEDAESDPATPKKRTKYLTPSPTPQKSSDIRYGLVVSRTSRYRHMPATPQSLPRPSRPGSSPKSVHWDNGDEQFDRLPRPQLVFRFYNNNSSGVNAPSGMRAGLFQDSRKLSQPPGIDSKAFRKEAAKHFSWTREPTPFISMYESILPVLHRGLLSTIDAVIAVIDLHAVSRSQHRNNSRVYMAAHIIKRLCLRKEAYGYRAISEWLVWGMIEKNAIVTTFKVEDLRRYLAGSPDVCIILRFREIETSRNANEYKKKLEGNKNQVGRASGRVVGKFLAFIKLPECYLERAAKKIARDWQLRGNKSSPRLKKYWEGVHLGLQRRADPPPSERARVKAQMTQYLQQVDSRVGRKQVESRQFRKRTSRPRLASYLRRVDLGQTHAKGTLSTKHGAADLSLKSDIFLSNRRRIETICPGS